jgi:hypothetical protein
MIKSFILLSIILLSCICYAAHSQYNGRAVTLMNDKWLMENKEVSLPYRMIKNNKLVELTRKFKMPEKTKKNDFDYNLIIDGGVGDFNVWLDNNLLIHEKLNGLPKIFKLSDIDGVEHDLKITISNVEGIPESVCGLSGVWLEKVPQIYIDDIRYDFKAGDKSVKVWYSIAGNTQNIPITVKAAFASRGALTFGYWATAVIRSVDSKSVGEIVINKIRTIESWSLLNPGRCRIRLTLLNGNKEIDEVTVFADAFNIGIEANKIKVNNSLITLQGVKLPGGITIFNGNDKNEISRMKKMGFNSIFSTQLPLLPDNADLINQNNLLTISYIDSDKISDCIKYSSQLASISGWFFESDNPDKIIDEIRKFDKSRFIIVKQEDNLLFYLPGTSNGFLMSDLNLSEINWQNQLVKAEHLNKFIIATNIKCYDNSEKSANLLSAKISKLRSSVKVIGYIVELPENPFLSSSGDPSELYTALISNNAKMMISADYKVTINKGDYANPLVKVIIDLPEKDKQREKKYTIIRVVDKPDGFNSLDKIDDFICGTLNICDVSSLFFNVKAEIPGDYAIHYALADEKGVISSCTVNFTAITIEKN